MTDEEIFDTLAKPFPPDKIRWRKGPHGKKLAYVDARDVQLRLTEAVGPWGWSTLMSREGGVTFCTLTITLPDGRTIARTDGAGETGIEGEKGSCSDAFKRAAVQFGVGRHLYDFENKGKPSPTVERVLGSQSADTSPAGGERLPKSDHDSELVFPGRSKEEPVLGEHLSKLRFWDRCFTQAARLGPDVDDKFWVAKAVLREVGVPSAADLKHGHLPDLLACLTHIEMNGQLEGWREQTDVE